METTPASSLGQSLETSKDSSSVLNSGNNSGIIVQNLFGDILNTPPKTLPSVLPIIIDQLSRVILESDVFPGSSPLPSEYKIEDKILCNGVVRHRNLVENYGAYCSLCEDALDAIDGLHPNSRKRFFHSAIAQYQTAVTKLGARLPFGVGVADTILDIVHAEYKRRIQDSEPQSLWSEDIDYTLKALVCFLFAECKILENPRSLNATRH